MGRGLDVLGDPQALHHGHDGPVPGRVVLAAPGGVRRAKGAVTDRRGRARPPGRRSEPPRLEDLAGGVHEAIERRTALHDTHVAAGARLDWSGGWMRPARYGDRARGDPRRARTRERDGRVDAREVPRRRPRRPDAAGPGLPVPRGAVAPGRSRYLLALDEGRLRDGRRPAGALDGRPLLPDLDVGRRRPDGGLAPQLGRPARPARASREPDGRCSARSTWPAAGPRPALHAERRRPGRGGHPVPRARRRSRSPASPAARSRSASWASCSFELHHPRGRGVALWDGAHGGRTRLGIRPHGLDALDVLRLEKGHIYLGQDTLPDDHPTKLGLGLGGVPWTSPTFVGKRALERMAELPMERKLVGLRVRRRAAARRAARPCDDAIVGRVTSCAASDAVGRGDRPRMDPRGRRRASRSAPDAASSTATVVPTPFYDPGGGASSCLSCRAARSRSCCAAPTPPRSTRSSRPATGRACCRTAPDEALFVCHPAVAPDVVARARRPDRGARRATPWCSDASDGWAGVVARGDDAARRALPTSRSSIRRRDGGSSRATSRTSPPRSLGEPDG